MKTLFQLSVITFICAILFSSCNNNPNTEADNNITYTTGADTTLSTIVVTADTISALAIFTTWNETPRLVAENVMDQYGAPNEHTPRMLIWYNNAPWEKTVVHKQVTMGGNTMQARDVVMEQTIMYKVPVDMIDELAHFNGNLIVDPARGALTARSNSEATNYLLVNLANDIITNKKTVQQAQQYYNDNLTTSNDYTKGFIFDYHSPAGEQQYQGSDE